MAAAAGLLVSGVATWATVAALRDQRTQSVSEDNQALRSRAGRVSAWIETHKGEYKDLHLINRSPDPVVNWGLLYKESANEVRINGYELERMDLRDTTPMTLLTALPPCSHSKIDMLRVAKLASIIRNPYGDPKPRKNPFHLVGITFYTSDGSGWIRNLQGSLVRHSMQSGYAETDGDAVPVKNAGKAAMCHAD
ncbi:hypothetical protein AB0I66_26900 [Streptomyces sp. NPDC050439]|uniref:hypothetical protein n=1 Tax=unclassified Streptomyces TaxID=2593676 RepID=UPI003440ED5A